MCKVYLYAVYFCMLFCHLLIFFRINLFRNSFRNTIRNSNSLDPDQAQQFFGPDLGPNCLQRLSASDTDRQRINDLVLDKQYVYIRKFVGVIVGDIASEVDHFLIHRVTIWV